MRLAEVVEAVAGEKSPRRGLRDDGAVEKQGAAVGIPGAELNVVADHEQGNLLSQECLQNLSECLLKFRVQPLGGLVQQQDFRSQQEHLCQSRPLLFAAGQVVRVPVEQFLQTAQPHRPSDPLLLRLSGESPALENLNEVLPDAFLHKKRLGILRQHTYPPNQLHLPPVRLLESGQQLQAGGLSGAVAAQ